MEFANDNALCQKDQSLIHYKSKYRNNKFFVGNNRTILTIPQLQKVLSPYYLFLRGHQKFETAYESQKIEISAKQHIKQTG